MGLTRARGLPTVEVWPRGMRESMMYWRGITAQTALCIGLIVVSTQAVAAALSQPDLNDVDFWFKLLLGMALGVGGWFLTKHDAKLEKLAEANLIDRVRLMEHEWRQVKTEISLVREGLPREYQSKDEMKEHFRKIEDSLNAMHRRLDNMRDSMHGSSRSIADR